MSRLRFLVVAALLSAVSLAGAQPRSDAVRERLKTRPGDPTLYYYLSLADLAEGHEDAALADLDSVARLGNGFLPPRGAGFDAIWERTRFREICAAMERKLPRKTDARELFRLEKGFVPEGITFDPRTRRWYVGSIALRKIVRVDSSGVATDFSRPGELRQVLGVTVDAARRRLHAVSISPDTCEVVTYDLDEGALVRSVRVPGAVQLNDVVAAAGGELYVTDTGSGGVYRVREAAVDTLVPPGTLPGANGLALSSDGSRLYVAHATGVARVRLADGAVLGRIEIPRGETIAAIDGLYLDGSALIGIQNVTNPGRVIRMALRADGDGVERVETLLSHHHPAIDEPTTGVIVGRTFALLATTQVTHVQPDGTILNPAGLKPAIVLSVAL